MKISMNKKYKTRNGLAVRILCVDAIDKNPVVGLINCNGTNSVHIWSNNGDSTISSDLDLVEDTPYINFKIDEPVLAYNETCDSERRGHFAGISENGYPTIWRYGGTSFTCNKDERMEVFKVIKYTNKRFD